VKKKQLSENAGSIPMSSGLITLLAKLFFSCWSTPGKNSQFGMIKSHQIMLNHVKSQYVSLNLLMG